MGLKKKWITNAEDERNRYVNLISKILKPMMSDSATVYISDDNEIDEYLPELLARMLNCQLLLEEDKELRQFGADDIMPLQFIITKNQTIELWGKIYWLSTPVNHKTFKNQLKDPFYCKMNFVDDELEVKQMLFGDFSVSDIEFNSWVKSEVNWIYEFEY